jgi:outer membrane protein
VQKHWLFGVLVFALPFPVWAEVIHPPEHIHGNFSHQEITLTKGLLPGLPVIDQPLKMEDAVGLGLQYSPALKATSSDVAFNRASFRQAGAQRWPTVSLGSNTFLHNQNNLTLMTPDMMMTTGKNTFFQDFNATAKVPLFTGGRIVAGIRAARSNWEGSQAGYKQEQAQTAFEIRQSYLTALLSEVEHTVHQQHLAVQNRLLQNAQAKYDVGKGLKADVLRIQAELASAQQMLNDEHVRLNNMLYDLKASMGIDLSSEIQLSETLTMRPWTGPNLDSLVQNAIVNHPRIMQAQSAVLAAKAEVKMAQSKYLPQVNGQITGNLRTPQDAPVMGNGVVGWVSASLPVLDRNRDTEIEKVQAKLMKAQQSLRVVQIDTAKRIAQAWTEMEFSQQNSDLATASILKSQEDLRLIQQRFNVGRAVIVEVQDAAYQFRQSQLNQAQAVFKYELAKAKLLQALGMVKESDALATATPRLSVAHLE